MKPTVLIVDVSALAYRSLYTTGDLSYQGVATGAVFGIFRAVLDLMELHSTTRVAWCFDRGSDNRKCLDSRYKANRPRDEDEDRREAKRVLRQQLYRLRTDYLPGLGFLNVFWQDDYEADDVIASVCHNLPPGDRGVVVSSDEDLYQLLVDDRVSMWSPATGRATTARSFREEWGIDPFMWADVKAIAGCPGDNVIGVAGVGPKTAVRFLTGTLKESTKGWQAIVGGREEWAKNERLVRLPFEGTREFTLRDDEPSDEAWGRLKSDLGFTSLRDRRLGRRAV